MNSRVLAFILSLCLSITCASPKKKITDDQAHKFFDTPLYADDGEESGDLDKAKPLDEEERNKSDQNTDPSRIAIIRVTIGTTSTLKQAFKQISFHSQGRVDFVEWTLCGENNKPCAQGKTSQSAFFVGPLREGGYKIQLKPCLLEINSTSTEHPCGPTTTSSWHQESSSPHQEKDEVLLKLQAKIKNLEVSRLDFLSKIPLIKAGTNCSSEDQDKLFSKLEQKLTELIAEGENAVKQILAELKTTNPEDQAASQEAPELNPYYDPDYIPNGFALVSPVPEISPHPPSCTYGPYHTYLEALQRELTPGKAEIHK